LSNWSNILGLRWLVASCLPSILIHTLALNSSCRVSLYLLLFLEIWRLINRTSDLVLLGLWLLLSTLLMLLLLILLDGHLDSNFLNKER
jgi:hypothetical protein